MLNYLFSSAMIFSRPGRGFWSRQEPVTYHGKPGGALRGQRFHPDLTGLQLYRTAKQKMPEVLDPGFQIFKLLVLALPTTS